MRALSADVAPLVSALERQPATLLHGDLKLANVGIAADGSMPTIDWQMVMVGPVAVELGWFLVANSASLPWTPSATLERYARLLGYAAEAAEDLQGSTSGVEISELDLAWVVGLLLRGWRKGLDAEAGVILASGVTAAEDLAEWCSMAIEIARRRL
jgi:aminoglycoside phosphotransferase (APT) family kinase protein